MSGQKKILMSGNEAIAQGALDAGCRFYAGYPITPQNELIAYMAKYLLESGGVFIQAESEIAAINMVFGASLTGARAMTSSSSPGISLKQEGISYLAGAELPAVIVNVMRAGPGLGDITPSQSDYFQATRGGGHGDYHSIVFAPASSQEAYDLMSKVFNLADRYRTPVIILADGMLGQVMEPVLVRSKKIKLSPISCRLSPKKWALTGCKGRKAKIIRSLLLGEGVLEKFNLKLQKKYSNIRQNEQKWESCFVDDADIIIVAYGTMARVAKGTILKLREKGYKIGLIRPISLWPFPVDAFNPLIRSSAHPKTFLVIEMSYGQMLEDVKLAVNGKAKVEFLGRAGGGIPTEKEIAYSVERIADRKPSSF